MLKMISGLFLCLLSCPVTAEAVARDDAWADLDAADNVEHVNEGGLRFLEQPLPEAVHAHYNRIELSSRSLTDGWASLYQCHAHLDAVPATQIVFNEDRIRLLRVVEFSRIGRAWVEGASVQLENVQPGAELCLAAESRMVEAHGNGSFVVRNGPFMRRFLDGFYPMHVTLVILLPPGDWVMASSRPVVQPGFSVELQAGSLHVDTWFEGALRTEFHFRPRAVPQEH